MSYPMSYPKPLQRKHHKSGKHRIKNPDALARQAERLEKELVRNESICSNKRKL